MPDQDTRWQNDKEWAGWTLRDELYGFIRRHLGPVVSGIVAALGSAIVAGIKSYPAIAGSIGSVVLTVSALTILAVREGRKIRAATNPQASDALPDAPEQIAVLKAQLSAIAARQYPTLPTAKITELAEELLNLPRTIVGRDNRQIDIRRDELADCMDLADGIAVAFRAADWRMHDDPKKSDGEKPLPTGIWVVTPPNDLRASAIADLLSKVLGPDYGSIRTKVESSMDFGFPSFVDKFVVVRIAIGRKARQAETANSLPSFALVEETPALPTKETLDILYATDDSAESIVWLKFLPDTPTGEQYPNRNGDAFLLILLGYRFVRNWDEVPTDHARGALSFSHCNFPTPDLREWVTPGPQLEPDPVAVPYIQRGYIEKAGLASGGKFMLTPEGMREAMRLFNDMIKRA